MTRHNILSAPRYTRLEGAGLRYDTEKDIEYQEAKGFRAGFDKPEEIRKNAEGEIVWYSRVNVPDYWWDDEAPTYN